MTDQEAALTIRNLSLRFRGLVALEGVSFEVPAGATFGIVGPNGAGKTALLNCISGIYRPSQGSIRVFGTEVVTRAPHRISALGIARTFQSTEHFSEFSVLDYVLLGRIDHLRCSVTGSLLLWPARQRLERQERRVVMDVLESLGLAEHASSRLGQLPYGIQKRVDIARAVAAAPKMMLVDEPTSGTTTSEREDVSRAIDSAAQSGITIVVIDHDVSFVRRHCGTIVVMDSGRQLALGAPVEVLQRPDVIEAFLGPSLAAGN